MGGSFLEFMSRACIHIGIKVVVCVVLKYYSDVVYVKVIVVIRNKDIIQKMSKSFNTW